MGADNLKYDPALGVYDEASLRAAGRYLDALHYEINGREDWIGDEYFRCERMLIAVERAISAHDHGIDEDDRYYRKPDQQDEAAAEIGRLRGEVDSAAAEECQVHREAHMRLDTIVMGAGVFELLHEGGMSDAWENTIAAVTKLATPAPAMPNGVEASREQFNAWMKTRGVISSWHVQQDMWNAWTASRAADNRDAAGVDRPAYPEGEVVGACVCGSWPGGKCLRCEWIPAPAAVPAGEAVAQTLRDALAYVGYRTDGDLSTLAERAELWMRESRVLIDSQSELIAWMKADATTPQPADGEAVATVCAAARARFGPAAHPHAVADWIEEQFRATPPAAQVQQTDERGRPMTYWGGAPAPVQAAPQEGEAEALARKFHDTYERLAPSFGYETRQETRQFDPETPNGRLMIAVCAELAAHPSACELGVAPEMAIAASGIRSNGMYVKGWNDCREATLQHRGDSQEVGCG